MVSLARLTRSQCLSTGGRSSASLFRTYVRSAVCHAPPQITPPTSVSLFRPHPVLRPASRRHVRVRGRSAALRGAADLPAAADAPGTCARTTCASAGGTFAAHQTPQVGTLQWHSEPLLSGRFFFRLLRSGRGAVRDPGQHTARARHNGQVEASLEQHVCVVYYAS